MLAAVRKTLPTLGRNKEDFVFVSGIGCAARFPYYMETYGMHSIHGRAPAFATGIKIANPELDKAVATAETYLAVLQKQDTSMTAEENAVIAKQQTDERLGEALFVQAEDRHHVGQCAWLM